MPSQPTFASLIRSKQRIAAVVAHTHWDRAWYHPFELFRLSLCRVFGRVLDVLDADPRYAHFTFDGQTVVAEDFLELHPEQRSRIQRPVRAGRLTLGPFYVLPDQFLITGEAHIRNGLIGQRFAESFGRSSRQGYVADPFGLTSQCPQIFAGLGIESIFLFRGTEQTADANRRTDLLVGRPRWPKPHPRHPPDQRLLQPRQLGVPLRGFPHGDPDTAEVDCSAATQQFQKVLDAYAALPQRSRILFFGSGNDHHPPQHKLPDLIGHVFASSRTSPSSRSIPTASCALCSRKAPRSRRSAARCTAPAPGHAQRHARQPAIPQAAVRPVRMMLNDALSPWPPSSPASALRGRVLREEHHFDRLQCRQ